MTDTATDSAADSEAGHGGGDRRGQVHIRAIFIQAYDVLLPFFDEANNWAGHTHEHLAYRALHERFPSLSGEDVFTIVAAAKRVFGSSGVPAPHQ